MGTTSFGPRPYMIECEKYVIDVVYVQWRKLGLLSHSLVLLFRCYLLGPVQYVAFVDQKPH